MLNRLSALVGALLLPTLALAQAMPNLVPNPSFEDHVALPKEISQLGLAKPWQSVATSGTEPAELFVQGALARVGVPDNFNGTEPAHSGTAYAGLIPFSKMDDGLYREFFYTLLREPLEAGATYRVGCFVSCAERAHWAVDGVQLLLTPKLPLLGQLGYTLYKPQVAAPDILREKTGWTEVSGSFVAKGGERVLTLGNFHLSQDTRQERLLAKRKDKEAGDIAYYYLDDVSVVKVLNPDGSPARLPAPVVLAPLPEPKVGEAVRLDQVYFDSDESRLLPQSGPSLDQLAALLQSHPQWRVLIGGHTDNTNTQAHNLLLSRERAEAVRQYLIGKGIPAARLRVQGFGDTQPMADNTSPAGREKNRRVEFTIEEE